MCYMDEGIFLLLSRFSVRPLSDRGCAKEHVCWRQ